MVSSSTFGARLPAGSEWSGLVQHMRTGIRERAASGVTLRQLHAVLILCRDAARTLCERARAASHAYTGRHVPRCSA